MQPRRTAPAPEVEYFLDGAQDNVELDSCSAMTLRLYGDDAVMLPIATQTFNGYRERRVHCLQMAAVADEILPHLPEHRRAGLIHMGLKNTLREVEQLAEIYANWAIDDEVEGGAMEPWRDVYRMRNGVIFKRTMRRLRSPKFIRRQVKKHAGEATHLTDLANIMLRRMRAVPIGSIRPDRAIMDDFRAQINFKRVPIKTERAKIRADRKMIVRSLNTAISILGQETVSAFLRGEEIKIAGSESILILRKRGALTDRGHGCLSVGLADRNGTRLADLCTYIESTPTLDQLAGFALWMQAGEDGEAIKEANVVSLSEAGEGHPLLVRETRRAREDLQDQIAAYGRLYGTNAAEQILGIIDGTNPLCRRRRRRHPPQQLTYEEKRQRNDAYWQETKEHWIGAMVVLVLGRSAKFLE
jgi:hypothetical protein